MLKPTKIFVFETRDTKQDGQKNRFGNHWDTRKGKKVGWASASTKKKQKIVRKAKNKAWYCKREKKVCIIEIARESGCEKYANKI